ncbi:MAG: hypothetical protein GX197_00655 [Firmicutes bacterium]|nr:hypothetical protein [Bacillota bacterium]
MNLKVSKKTVIFTCLIFILLYCGTALAHGMLLKLEEPGVFRVEYDGGGFSTSTEVILYDQNDKVLAQGLVDEKGKFYFDPNLEVYRAVANDGMGHRAEYKEGVKVSSLPKLPVVIGVIVVAVAVSVYFSNKSKQKLKVL